MLKHFSLFTGIGGIDLAAEWAGFETVGQCEYADYPTKVLEKHWPNVPRWRDIRDVTRESIQDRGIGAIDIITGGFPCQDVSIAGEKAGLIDGQGNITRSGLWFEMLRVINELRPKWVIAENVAGLLSNDEGRTFSTIIEGLENSHYKALPILSPACNYGASFEGKRIFIVATPESSRYRGRASKKLGDVARKLVTKEQGWHKAWGETERCIVQSIRNQKALPDNLRSNYGLSDWVDRLKCLGNAVVPQQVYPILKAIADIELKQK